MITSDMLSCNVIFGDGKASILVCIIFLDNLWVPFNVVSKDTLPSRLDKGKLVAGHVGTPFNLLLCMASGAPPVECQC